MILIKRDKLAIMRNFFLIDGNNNEHFSAESLFNQKTQSKILFCRP